MIYWALLLHVYQPPTQSHDVLRKVCRECYRPLLKIIGQNTNARISLNISAVLTEMLWEHNSRDVIDGIKDLAAKGRLELVDSGKYHPVFPLIPQEEQSRQIELNRRTNRRFFGEFYKPRGFFPPELAYSPDMAATLIHSGHDWLLVSGVSCPVAWPLNVVHYVERDGRSIKVLFRDDVLSNRISFRKTTPGQFLNDLRQLQQDRQDIYVVTAMDGETFGHHNKGWDREFLEESLRLLASNESDGITLVTVSDLVDAFPPGQAIEAVSSSWSSSRSDLEEGNPYPLWDSPGNNLHRWLWAHLNACIQMTKKAKEVATTEEAQSCANTARLLLDQSLHSCQFFWASRRPMWDADMVLRGLLLQQHALLTAFRAIQSSRMPTEEFQELQRRLEEARSLRSGIEDALMSPGA